MGDAVMAGADDDIMLQPQQPALPVVTDAVGPANERPRHASPPPTLESMETAPKPPNTSKPDAKPTLSPNEQPRATLIVVAPTLAPEPTPKPTANPTVKPTQKPVPSPESPQPTETPVTPPEEPSAQPEKTAAPAAGYTDATHLCSAFMDAINTEKAANGAASGNLDSGLCNIAQDRARQMAEACRASHIGSGHAETVGAMGSENGATNRGRNSVHHSPQLMDCVSFGIGVAIGSDGMYYYSIIGE